MSQVIGATNLAGKICEGIGIVLLIADTSAGLFISIMLDYKNPWHLLNAFVFIFALPLYIVIRMRSMKMAMGALWCLLLLRWLVECFDGRYFQLLNPIAWPPGPFLLAGLIVLQISYLLIRREPER
jgi:hypothetical protein